MVSEIEYVVLPKDEEPPTNVTTPFSNIQLQAKYEALHVKTNRHAFMAYVLVLLMLIIFPMFDRQPDLHFRG